MPDWRYCDKVRCLGLLPAPSGGVSSITTPYYEGHRVLRPGSRVIIATQQQINGWRDMFRRLDVIVPSEQAPATQPKSRRTAAEA